MGVAGRHTGGFSHAKQLCSVRVEGLPAQCFHAQPSCGVFSDRVPAGGCVSFHEPTPVTVDDETAGHVRLHARKLAVAQSRKMVSEQSGNVEKPKSMTWA